MLRRLQSLLTPFRDNLIVEYIIEDIKKVLKPKQYTNP